MNAVAAKTRVALNNILFATDFSPAAEAALPYAIGLAKQYGGKVHGLHVRFPATYPIVGPEAMPQVLEAAEEQAKFEAKQLHEMLADVSHEVTIMEGDLWPVLNEIVEQQKVDLIVMGTHGRKGVSRALLGSAAEEIFRKASSPGAYRRAARFAKHGAPAGNETDSLRDGFFAGIAGRAAVRGVSRAGASIESDVAECDRQTRKRRAGACGAIHGVDAAPAASPGAGGSRPMVRAEIQGRARAGGGENHGGGHSSWCRPDRPRRTRTARRSGCNDASARVHCASGGC